MSDRHQPDQHYNREPSPLQKVSLEQSLLHTAHPQVGLGKRYHRLRIGLHLLFFFLLSSVVFVAWPLFAAIQLNYFDIFVAADMITLEWSTANEYNTAGFEVYGKEEDQPDSKFHLIDQRIAQGGVGQSAIYRLDLTEGLEPGVSYCFRLREVTTDNTIGEVLQICGYGLNITPTPRATPTLSGGGMITATGNITGAMPLTNSGLVTFNGASGIPNQIAPFDLTATSQAIFIAPTFTPMGEFSPLATPDPLLAPPTPFIPTPDPFGVPPVPPISPTLALDGAQTYGAPLTAAQNLTMPTELAGSVSNPITTNDPLALGLVNTNGVQTDPLSQPATAAPNPPYIVLTATPVAAVVPALPTFTPYPTAIAVANAQVMGTVLPSTQNLLMLLLCGVFSGASGLGILGLITTLLYMRARSDKNAARK